MVVLGLGLGRGAQAESEDGVEVGPSSSSEVDTLADVLGGRGVDDGGLVHSGG